MRFLVRWAKFDSWFDSKPVDVQFLIVCAPMISVGVILGAVGFIVGGK